MKKTKQPQKKAVLAIFIAGSLLNSYSPALSKDEAQSSENTIDAIADFTKHSLNARAFFLLQLAKGYLASENSGLEESQIRSYALADKPYRKLDDAVANWCKYVSKPSQTEVQTTLKNEQTKTSLATISSRNCKLAKLAVRKSLALLNESDDNSTKLNLYYIACQILKTAGDLDGAKKCEKILENAFKVCEESTPAPTEQITSALAVLDSMAYAVIPFDIPDWNPVEQKWRQPAIIKPFTDTDFKESEKFRLRAASISDRLPEANHVRRKERRDLALWYSMLGKASESEAQKQILFQLVGAKDDALLYPQSPGCGHKMWWHPEKIAHSYDCGMG